MRSRTTTVRRRGALALSVACALGLPLAAHAQAQESAREQQLEQRVSQLEQQLAELKSMIKAQQAAPAQAQPAPGTAGAPQAAQAGQAAPNPAYPPPVQGVPAQSVVAAPPGHQFQTIPGVTLNFHGFINATAFSQSKNFNFGNGQNAEYPVPGAKGSLTGVDVRNTRFWFDFTGPQLSNDWQGGGRIEADFFGGFNGTGAYSGQQEALRLRAAYITLSNPSIGTKLQIGQQWNIFYPLDMLPNSVTHLAFPLGFGNGIVGWRFPGIAWFQELNHGSSGPIWRVDLAAYSGSWNGPGSTTNFQTAANAGFRPQVEARLHVDGKDWLAYTAIHYSRIDPRGIDGTTPTAHQGDIKSVGYDVGASWHPGPWVFKGLLYTGQGLGQLFGALSQFGDIKEKGGFLQAGYNFTSHWAAFAYFGGVSPNTNDVLRWRGIAGNATTGLLRSRQGALSLQYTISAYQFGLELMHDKLDYTTDGDNRKTTSGNQISLSALYNF